MAEPQGPARWDFDVDVDESNGDGKARATVALVSQQIVSVERLIDAGFKDVQRQLDSVSGLPERVTRLEERVKGLEKDVTSDEQQQVDVATWKRGAVTAACLALFGTLVNLLISAHII